MYGVVFASGCGARLTDVDGQQWLDLTCGFSTSNFGHNYPPLVEAVQAQLARLTHLTSEPHVGRIRLAEQLLQAMLPGQPPAALRVVFNSSGARAVESAWKACRQYRPGKLLTLLPSFHGRSIATAVASQTQRSIVGQALEAEVLRWPARHYPYCAQCPQGLAFPECGLACGEPLFQELTHRADEISAVMVEPVMTARGYIFPPKEYFLKLRRVTAALGISLISDEIQTGLGRCGSLCVAVQQGWQPDLVVLGKSLGGGMLPISAVVGRAEILDAIPRGAESETFAATPLACAAAEKVLQLLETTHIIRDGQRAGRVLRDQARQFVADCRVEGEGAVCALEFRLPGRPAPSAQAAAHDFALRCREQHIRAHLTGPMVTRVVLLPPLTITDEELHSIPWKRLTRRF